MLILLNACVKERGTPQSNNNITVANYIKKTKALIASNAAVGSRTSSINQYIDYTTTSLREITDNGVVYMYFYTKIIKDDVQIGALIGQVFDNRRILNYTVEPSLTGPDSFTNYYRGIDDSDLGWAAVEKDKVIRTYQTEPEVGESDYTSMARTWWGCTRECVSDAHIACYLDKECMTLLTLTNVAGTGTSFGGQGSGSIAVACSIACLKNKNLDLLPQY